MERLARSAIKGAPYNPRVISEANRKKLQKALQTVGLLEPVIWNRTTGFLVGGHQRLSALDALEGSDNYLLDVAVVELTDAAERAANVALNNPSLQGEYDSDLLAELLKTPDLQLEATGFDFADIQVAFDDPELATMFAPNEPTAKVLTEVEKQQAAAKTKKRLQTDRAERGAAHADDQDTENYAVVPFQTRGEREAFVAFLGYPPDERYVDGAALMAKLEAGIPKPKAPTPTVAKGEAMAKPGRSIPVLPTAPSPASKPAPKAKG